jgi:hypothetical protein
MAPVTTLSLFRPPPRTAAAGTSRIDFVPPVGHAFAR